MFAVGFMLLLDRKVLRYKSVFVIILIKKLIKVSFEAGYLSPMVSMPTFWYRTEAKIMVTSHA